MVLQKRTGEKVWGQGRDGGVYELPYVQNPQDTSTYIFLHVVYNLYWTSLNQSEWFAMLKHSYPNGRFLYIHCTWVMWLVDFGRTYGHSWAHPIPTLSPCSFHQWVHLCIFFNFSKIFNVIVCLLFRWSLAILNYLIATTSINTYSYIFTVSTSGTSTRTRKESQPKLQQLHHWTVSSRVLLRTT